MAIRKIKNHGKWVWQARVSYRGLRRAAFRASKEAARQAQADLLGALTAETAQMEQQGQRPATLRQLLEFYALDMRARGKGEESVGRVDYTRRSIEGLVPDLLGKPVSALADADARCLCLPQRSSRSSPRGRPPRAGRDPLAEGESRRAAGARS